MALNANTLGTAIGQAILAKFPSTGSTLPPEVQAAVDAAKEDAWTKVGEAIAGAIVEHFTENAEVLPDGAPAMAADGDPVVGKGRIT